MKKSLFVLAVLLVLSSAAGATDLINWTGTLTSIGPSFPPGYVKVVVNAIETTGVWDWSYALTPSTDGTGGANDISIFSQDLSAAQNLTISSPTAVGGTGTWSFVPYNGTNIKWVGGNIANGVTATFGYKSISGPSISSLGYAQDHGQYAGILPTPVVPEPMSIFLGALGLGTIGGFRRLRRK